MRAAGRIILAAVVGIAFAASGAMAAESETGAEPQPIPAGTVITMQNWQTYQNFMTDGMKALFAGTYHWKFPADFQMMVDKTHRYSYPAAYVENTEKYSHLVKIVNIPPDRHDITGYVAGLPFPDPKPPLMGFKLIIDMWYAYAPHITCTDNGKFALTDRFNNMSSVHWILVNRQFGHISDTGTPIYDPAGPGIFDTQMFEVTEPEQAKYTTSLTVFYLKLEKPEDTFLFIPALRRTLRLSSAARCSPQAGSDYAIDDTGKSTQNGNPTRFGGKYVGDRSVLEMIHENVKLAATQSAFYMPVYFPKPEVGKWETRNSWMLDLRRVPSERAGYCYGKKRLYIDKEVYRSIWADIYDTNMKLWKIDVDPTAMINVPGEGSVWSNNGWGAMLDVQNSHMTHVDFGPHGFWANGKCANVDGHNFTDAGRYSSIAGLSQIMR